MQTFLPFPSFKESAEVLDYKRLGKQRLECYTILQMLAGISSGWANHPCVKQWRNNEDALIAYYNSICREWVKRGYKHTMPILIPNVYERPEWLGDESYHASHRSNLLRKNFEYYSQFDWNEPDNLPYIWPIPLES